MDTTSHVMQNHLALIWNITPISGDHCLVSEYNRLLSFNKIIGDFFESHNNQFDPGSWKIISLVPGSWIWDPGILEPGSWIPGPWDPGPRIRDPGSRIPGSRIRNPGSGTPDPGPWIRDPRSGIQDSGFRIRDPGSRVPDPGSRIPVKFF